LSVHAKQSTVFVPASSMEYSVQLIGAVFWSEYPQTVRHCAAVPWPENPAQVVGSP
jgi:hypothetical protein